MSTVKFVTHKSKYSLCDKILENLHNNHPENSIHHYAVILPTGEHNGWCEKVSYWC